MSSISWRANVKHHPAQDIAEARRGVRSFFTINQGRAERAVRLAARVALNALPRTGIGSELSDPDRPAGAMRPRGLSPLPVRPLRLRACLRTCRP